MGSNQSSKKTPPQDVPEPKPIIVKKKIPTLNHQSKLLTPEAIEKISEYLPNDDFREEWDLLFSSTQHGHSFSSFRNKVCDNGETLIIIQEENGYIFGGFAAVPWKEKYGKFYGNMQCFIFSITPEIEIYRPTGLDENIMYLNDGSHTLFNGFGFGGQQNYFALAVESDFDKGHSRGSPSSTFGNEPLSKSDYTFKTSYIEAYQIRPPDINDPDRKYRLLMKQEKTGVLHDDDNADKKIFSFVRKDDFHKFEDSPQQEFTEKGSVYKFQDI